MQDDWLRADEGAVSFAAITRRSLTVTVMPFWDSYIGNLPPDTLGTDRKFTLVCVSIFRPHKDLTHKKPT
jgi:hypothetical protein